MQFDDLDERLRVFERIGDEPLPTEGHLLARLDGRGFTKLTKGRLELAKPFDPSFRDVMVATARHLMHSSLEVLYAYTQSDEISLWFAPEERSFGRKPRKLLSILAGEASASFSLALAVVGSSIAGSRWCPTSIASATIFVGGSKTRSATR
jgi:tRNA(His) 5'-end guanylyltransferase